MLPYRLVRVRQGNVWGSSDGQVKVMLQSCKGLVSTVLTRA